MVARADDRRDHRGEYLPLPGLHHPGLCRGRGRPRNAPGGYLLLPGAGAAHGRRCLPGRAAVLSQAGVTERVIANDGVIHTFAGVLLN